MHCVKQSKSAQDITITTASFLFFNFTGYFLTREVFILPLQYEFPPHSPTLPRICIILESLSKHDLKFSPYLRSGIPTQNTVVNYTEMRFCDYTANAKLSPRTLGSNIAQ